MNAVTPIRTSATAEVELTILMPCLDEAETIGTCIAKAKRFLSEAKVAGEVLIADNGSTDGSREIATGLGAIVVPVDQRGYGAALLGGIAAARGRYVIMGDADDSYDFSALQGFLERLRGGAELVMGNRFSGGIAPGAMPFLHRYLGNPVLSFIGRLFFGVGTRDFHCGLRGFDRDAIRGLDLQTAGMEFASEMVVRAALADLRIEEVPTTLRPDGRSRPPHLRTWRDGWRHLKFLLMHNPRWLFFIPGATLFLLGTLLCAMLFVGPVRLTGSMELGLNSFLAGCFMIITGAQLGSFGVLSRYYADITGMLPANGRSTWLARAVSTDRLALAGGACSVLGFAVFGYALHAWASVDFGALPDPTIPRVVVLGLTLTVLGIQGFFSAFLLGILDIPVRRARRAAAPPAGALPAAARA